MGRKDSMTNLEKIRNRSLEETATYILRHDDLLCDKICNAQGDCPYGDDVESVDCIECIRRWLNQDVNEGGTI